MAAHLNMTRVMIRVGTGCSRLEAPLHALQQLGVPYEHVFSSEICSTVRKQLKANHNPQILFEDVLARDNTSAPYVDLCIACWPCQGNSLLGKRRGLRDPRTRVVSSLLEYIHLNGPKIVILEMWQTPFISTMASNSTRCALSCRTLDMSCIGA